MSKLKTFIFFAILALILAIRFFLFFQEKTTLREGEYLNFETTLFSEPQITLNSQKLKVRYQGSQLSLKLPVYPQFSYGDRVKIQGYVKKNVFVSKQNNRLTEVSYLSLTNPKIEAVKLSNSLFTNKKETFLALIILIRQRLIEVFNLSLPINFASLMLGITFGIKGEFTSDFLTNLRQTGVMHVIAASGMNVTMTAGFLSSIAIIFFKRQTALILSIIGIAFYAFLAGFEASIVRASIMGILVFSAQIIGRQTLASYSLFLTAFIMLFVSPEQIENLGFQLSFLSTAGILYLSPLIARLKNLIKVQILFESFATTFAAQIATLPILILNFNTYPFWSIPVNMLVLWTVPYLMLLGAIGSIMGIVFLPVGQLVLLASLPLLIYFEKVVNFMGEMGNILIIPTLPWQIVASYYCFLLGIVFFCRRYAKTNT